MSQSNRSSLNPTVFLAAFVTFVSSQVSMIPPAMSGEPVGVPLVEVHDMDDLHTTWKNLANEQVIYPLDMRDFPVRLDASHQLFLDNYLIAESANVCLLYTSPSPRD